MKLQDLSCKLWAVRQVEALISCPISWFLASETSDIVRKKKHLNCAVAFKGLVTLAKTVKTFSVSMRRL